MEAKIIKLIGEISTATSVVENHKSLHVIDGSSMTEHQ